MMRVTLREYLALFRTRGGLASSQPAQTLTQRIWTRNFAAASRLSIRIPSPRILKSLPARPSLRNSLPKLRTSPQKIPRRNFHRTSRLRSSEAEGASKTKQESQGLSARLKKLSREYGWAAVGVYLGLSVLDFPFCFLLVRWVGTEKIGAAEHFVVSHVEALIPENVKNRWREYRKALKQKEKDELGDNGEITEHVEMVGWGVEEAEARHKEEASLGTQLALAYAIHKSFIFIRVPLTAAITPKVVKTLRSWGWNIGKRVRKGGKN